MANEKTEEKPKEKWIVTDIPDTTKPAVVDANKKEVYTAEQTQAKILNILEKLQKLLD